MMTQRWARSICVALLLMITSLCGCNRPTPAPSTTMITGEYMPFEPYVPPASPTRPAVPGERDADEADVREMVFRQEFLGLKGDEVIFLSYGMADGQWIEPPEAFLRRFDDL